MVGSAKGRKHPSPRVRASPQKSINQFVLEGKVAAFTLPSRRRRN